VTFVFKIVRTRHCLFVLRGALHLTASTSSYVYNIMLTIVFRLMDNHPQKNKIKED